MTANENLEQNGLCAGCRAAQLMFWFEVMPNLAF
jgi:hypothetical protein